MQVSSAAAEDPWCRKIKKSINRILMGFEVLPVVDLGQFRDKSNDLIRVGMAHMLFGVSG